VSACLDICVCSCIRLSCHQNSLSSNRSDSGECGGFHQPVCEKGDQCECGLVPEEDGTCVEDPAGCLMPQMQSFTDGMLPGWFDVHLVNASSVQIFFVLDSASHRRVQLGHADGVLSQSGPGFKPAPNQSPCGILDAKPCRKPRVQPCECTLYLDPETGLCKAEVSPGALCPQRPYCGYDLGPPCAFPHESPCDECNEVDPIASICVRNPTCTPGMLLAP
jgi:hypothetical protein